MQYTMLPFKFGRFSNHKVLMVNACGEHHFLSASDFKLFTERELSRSSDLFLDLKGKHFVTDTAIAPIVDLLATKYRTKKEFLRHFTSLHMVVVTARCNHSCRYCHASSGEMAEMNLDMTTETAERVVQCIFQTPSPIVKIEFQGGEPLLNFDIVKLIVKRAKQLNRKIGKSLEFVIATNLTSLDKNQLRFIKKHKIDISTSLDGPKQFHDSCRLMLSGKSSYDAFIDKLTLTRKYAPNLSVSSLLTITKFNIDHLREVIDEYIRLGFQGIFLRALNPYGRATCEEHDLGYSVDRYCEAYKDALRYIIDKNLEGCQFAEYNASMFLAKILTPYPTGFVDVQFPSGAGIMGIIYDYDGNVYPTDESRMLARVGDSEFRLGHVGDNEYMNIFTNDKLARLTESSCAEIMPGCDDCVYNDYCGSDPIRYYEESHDIMGHRPTSDYCKKNKFIITCLMELIEENNHDVMDVLWSWITRRSVDQIRRI